MRNPGMPCKLMASPPLGGDAPFVAALACMQRLSALQDRLSGLHDEVLASPAEAASLGWAAAAEACRTPRACLPCRQTHCSAICAF